jgi:hypothetical protein
MEWTRQQEVNQIQMGRPHFVILGAGASRAACPQGDADGRHLPVMTDFVDTLELREILLVREGLCLKG